MNRLVPLLAAVLAISLIAAGCGSSKKSDTTSGGAPAISKAEFIKKGNAICADGNKQIEAGGKKLFGANPKTKPTKSQLTEFATTVLLPSLESQVSRIRALGAPSGDEAKVKAILDAADQGVAKGKQDPAVLTTEGPGPLAQATKLAREYGLKVCGS